MHIGAKVSAWWRDHVSGAGASDYVPRESLVDHVGQSPAWAAAVGAGFGAAAGATAGYVHGMGNLARDEVSVVTRTFETQRPVLVGADYDPESSSYIPDPDGDGPMSGYWQTDPAHWDPLIEKRGTGQTWSRKEFVHTEGWGPISSAIVGAVGGAVVGGLLGVAIRLLHRALDSPSQHAPQDPVYPVKRGLARAADHAPLAGTLAGTAVGALAGAYAGQVSEARAQVLTQTVMEPQYRNEIIGWIPRVSQRRDIPRELFHPGHKIYYSELPEGRFGDPPFSERGQAITRSVPTGEFRPTEVTEKSHSLTPLTGALAGAALGAATGFATGVAAGVLLKLASGEE